MCAEASTHNRHVTLYTRRSDKPVRYHCDLLLAVVTYGRALFWMQFRAVCRAMFVAGQRARRCATLRENVYTRANVWRPVASPLAGSFVARSPAHTPKSRTSTPCTANPHLRTHSPRAKRPWSKPFPEMARERRARNSSIDISLPAAGRAVEGCRPWENG